MNFHLWVDYPFKMKTNLYHAQKYLQYLTHRYERYVV